MHLCSVKSLTSFSNYLSLIKFSHTIFAMPFALIGFTLGLIGPITFMSYFDGVTWIQNQPFTFSSSLLLLLFKVLLCMVFARSAAMAFNRYIDEKYDKLNPRTAVREIPAGIIKKGNALWFVIVNCALFVATTFFINKLCFFLSPVALFVILFYSYTKRFTALCHLVLGVGLALAPIGAYMAVTARFEWLPLLFSAVVLTWVSGFDILYALQDEDFDREQKLNSIPVLLGRKKALFVSILLHIITAVLVLLIGLYISSIWYVVGAFLFIALLVYQHTLVKPNDISKVNMAFATTNGIASVVFSIFVIIALLKHY